MCPERHLRLMLIITEYNRYSTREYEPEPREEYEKVFLVRGFLFSGMTVVIALREPNGSCTVWIFRVEPEGKSELVR